MGGGEGVGWSAPTPSSPHSLAPALANTLKHLALVTPKEEGELARRQVIEIWKKYPFYSFKCNQNLSNSNRLIKTGSNKNWKIIYSIVLLTIFHEKKSYN